jgi:hypothetical protein
MSPPNKLTTDQLSRLIYEIRGERVMLDSDLAAIYGVETKALNRAAKRNADRFPKDFMFQISSREWQNLKCQIGTSSSDRESQVLRYRFGTLKTGHGGRRKLPYVFTEHGAIMAAKKTYDPWGLRFGVQPLKIFRSLHPNCWSLAFPRSRQLP